MPRSDGFYSLAPRRILALRIAALYQIRRFEGSIYLSIVKKPQDKARRARGMAEMFENVYRLVWRFAVFGAGVHIWGFPQIGDPNIVP